MRSIQLQHPDGTQKQWITPDEAKRMKAYGQVERVTATKYRLRPEVAPSESKTSAPMLKRADLNALLGIAKCNETRLERLIGHGMIPSNAWVTDTGRIRVC